MEDSFNARVDKTFGSLQASSSSSSQPPSSLNSLWSLTDEEIERNKWLQDKIDPQKDTDELIHRLNNPKPYSPFLQGLVSQPRTSNPDLESDIQELDDDEEDDDDDENQKSQLSKPEDHSNEEWDIRTSVGMDCTLDNEEEEDAFDKVAVGKEESADRFYMKDVNDYEIDIDPTNELPRSFTDVTRDPRANHTAAKLRLKEDEESARKLGLQVSENNIQESNQIATESKQQIVMNEPPGSSSSVPDYGSAAMEIEDDVSADSLTSVVFTPRKKSGDVSMKKSKVDGHEDKKAVSISIADSDEVCMMDEDEPEVATDKSSSLQKSGRRYRTRGGTSVE
ncbi:putative tumor suppressing sub-chromosomal transferable candidate 4 [Helianthus debilis subsp. tardiflorus]